MGKFILNNQTDGDGVYHVHSTTCSYKPNSDYTNLNAVSTKTALAEAQKIQPNARGCKHCF